MRGGARRWQGRDRARRRRGRAGRGRRARPAATSWTTTRAAGGSAAAPRTRRWPSPGSACASGRSSCADDQAAESTRARGSCARPAWTCGSCPRARGPDLHQRRDARRAAPARPAGLGPGRPGGAARRRGGRARAWMFGAGRGRARRTPGRTSRPPTRWSPSAGRACSGSSCPASPSSGSRPGPSPIVRRADLVGVGRDDVAPGTPRRGR